MDPLKMYFLFKMGIFHCYVCLPEGNFWSAWLAPLKSSGWSWVGVVFFDPCKKELFKLGEYEIQTGGVKAKSFQGLARLSNRGIFNVERFPVVGFVGFNRFKHPSNEYGVDVDDQIKVYGLGFPRRNGS